MLGIRLWHQISDSKSLTPKLLPFPWSSSWSYLMKLLMQFLYIKKKDLLSIYYFLYCFLPSASFWNPSEPYMCLFWVFKPLPGIPSLFHFPNWGQLPPPPGSHQEQFPITLFFPPFETACARLETYQTLEAVPCPIHGSSGPGFVSLGKSLTPSWALGC